MVDHDLAVLAERLQGLCLERGLTVATAESCTGGLVAATLTDVPGSSAYVLGGVIAYSDRAKVDLLGIRPPVIAAHGAVSIAVAREMARGARERFGVSMAVSVTGVAGPGGGSDDKPVGLTFIGLADAIGIEIRRFDWTGDRAWNRRASVHAAIAWLADRAAAVNAAQP